MNEGVTIEFLNREQINNERWDNCIRGAANGLVYGYSFYLDAMCPGWKAVIRSDYSAVMPLPARKKWGFSYIYQPFLTAQLGLFGNDLSAELLESFLKSIPSRFRLWEFPFNQGNCFTLPSFPLYQRRNFVLSLRGTYEELYRGFRETTKRNIRKSLQYGCVFKKEIPLNQVIALAKMQHEDERGFNDFAMVFEQMNKTGTAVCHGVYSAAGELLASCALLFSHNRIYYLLVGNHPNGRTLGASHLLIDRFISEYAGSDLLLDFEGSDLRNLAFFYSSFGANEEIYTAIRYNRLPWYVRLLKK